MHGGMRPLDHPLLQRVISENEWRQLRELMQFFQEVSTRNQWKNPTI